MKILLIHNSKALGGGTLSLLDVAEGITTLGHDLDILLPPGEFPAKKLILDNKFNAIENNSQLLTFNYYNGGPNLIKIGLKKIKYYFINQKSKKYWEEKFNFKKYDTVILNSSVLSPMIKIINKNNSNIIMLVRETIKSTKANIINSIISKRISSSKAVAFLSEFDKRTWDVTTKYQYIIPDTLNNKLFRINLDIVRIKIKMNIPLDYFVILYTGGFSQLKGLHTLLKAYTKFQKDKIMLIVLGDDGKQILNSSLRTKLFNFKQFLFVKKQYDKIKKSNNKIKVIGNVEDPSEWYEISDIVIFPASKPHQSRPLYEAGYFSKPIIAPRFDNYNEYLIEGYNGYYYQPQNSKDLYNILSNCIESKEELKQIGLHNKQMTKHKHNFENFITQIQKLLVINEE